MAAIIRPCALLSLAIGAMAGPMGNYELFERATCKDNLGRCFNPTGTASKDIASRSAATAFCSSFLSIPVVTSIVATTTPQTSLTLTATVTDATVTQTSVATQDVEATATVQTTITTTLSPNDKRANPTEAPPKCGTSAAPSAYSSACACVSVTPSTTYITATAPVATNTALETLSQTATTLTIETTTVTTGTATVVETSVATQTPAPKTCADFPNTINTKGKSFTKTCGSLHSTYVTGFVIPPQTSIAGCIDACATTTGCKFAVWYSSAQQCFAFGPVFPGAGRVTDPDFDEFQLVEGA